jgi:hypothetical protein
MAESAIAGLFQTPEMYQQARLQQQQEEAANYARMDPMQRATYGTYMAGQQIGAGIGQLFGVQDPQLQRISQRNALARQFDLNTPNGLMQYSNALQQSGDMQGASAVADRARAINAALVEQGAKLATTQKTIAETGGLTQTQQGKRATIQQLQQQYGLDETQAAAIANNPDLVKSYLTPQSGQAIELLKTGKYTPESISNWATGLGALELVDLSTKPSEEWLRVARGFNLPAKQNFNEYTAEQVVKVNEKLLQDELRKKSAGAALTRVSVETKGQEAFAVKRQEEQAKALTEAAASARGASQALGTLADMSRLDASGQLFTGPLANAYVGGTNFLASIGLLSPDQTKKLTSSQVYDKQAKDLVMQDLGGKLGAQISDSDRKYVEARIPQLTTSAQARTELIAKISEIQKGKIDYWKQINSHANKFGNLNDFDIAIPYAPPTPASSTGSTDWKIRPKT